MMMEVPLEASGEGRSFEAIDTLVHECLKEESDISSSSVPRGIKRMRNRVNKGLVKGGTITFEMTCTKRHVTFVWALLECLLFTGLIFGWPWFLSTLRRNRYFLDLCNVTLPEELNYHEADTEDSLLKPGGIHDFDASKKHRIKCRPRTTTVATTTNPAPYYDLMLNYTYFCDDQERHLEMVYSMVYLLRNALVFPLGFFLDMYGTTRTRLLTILIFIVGTLMMTFSNSAFPWLVIPAFTMYTVAGCVIMLTNLQISNLFGGRRYTIMSTLLGSYNASAIVFLCIKSMNDIQTSFMFMTMGVVPILVSTIAFLPKTKIPWPLPADYGEGRTSSNGARHRSSSGDGHRCCLNLRSFKTSASSSIFIWSVIWFCIYQLRAFVYDTNLRSLFVSYGIHKDEVNKYSELFGSIQTISLPVGPLVGLLVDWRRNQSHTGNPLVLQMKNVQFIIFVTFGVALLNSIIVTVPSVPLQVTGFFTQAIERVAVMTSVCAFLTHLHFPAEHFGKLIGLHFLASSVICLLKIPLHSFMMTDLYGDPFYINLLLLALLLVSCAHPFVILYHCRIGLLLDASSSSNTDHVREQFVVTIEDEESRGRMLQT